MTPTLTIYNTRRGGSVRLDAIVGVVGACRVDKATGMRGLLAAPLFGPAVAVLVRPPGSIMSTDRVTPPDAPHPQVMSCGMTLSRPVVPQQVRSRGERGFPAHLGRGCLQAPCEDATHP
jgi:hypothetical protein